MLVLVLVGSIAGVVDELEYDAVVDNDEDDEAVTEDEEEGEAVANALAVALLDVVVACEGATEGDEAGEAMANALSVVLDEAGEALANALSVVLAAVVVTCVVGAVAAVLAVVASAVGAGVVVVEIEVTPKASTPPWPWPGPSLRNWRDTWWVSDCPALPNHRGLPAWRRADAVVVVVVDGPAWGGGPLGSRGTAPPPRGHVASATSSTSSPGHALAPVAGDSSIVVGCRCGQHRQGLGSNMHMHEHACMSKASHDYATLLRWIVLPTLRVRKPL